MERVELQPHRGYPIRFYAPLQKGAEAVYKYALWLLVPVAILLLGPERWELAGIVGAVGLVAIRWIAFGTPLPQTRLNPLILVLLALTAVSFRVSASPDLAIPAATKTVAAVLVFFVMIDLVKTPSDAWNIVGVFVLLGVLFAYAAPFSVIWMSDKVFSASFFYDREWTRLIDPINPNKMAGSIAPLVPLAVCLLFAPKRWLRILGAIALPPMLVMLLVLQSRGVFIALAVGFVACLLFVGRKNLPLMLGAAVLTAVAFVAIPTFVPHSFFDLNSPAFGSMLLEYRADLWKLTVPLLVESPWIGTGLAAFPDVAQARFPRMLGEVHFSHPHNMFLHVAVDTGIVGGLAFVAILTVAIAALWTAYRGNVERNLSIGLFAAFTILIVHGMVDSIFWASKPAFLLWGMFALALVLKNSVKGIP